MSDVSGIPNMGFGGGAYFAGNPGFASQPQYLAQHNANQAYVSAQQPSQAQLYGGGSFGAQPAYYAGIGAAYGRATGGFKPAAAAAPPPAAYGYAGMSRAPQAPAPSMANFRSPSASYGAFQAPSSSYSPYFGQPMASAAGRSLYMGGANQNPMAGISWPGASSMANFRSPSTSYGSFQGAATPSMANYRSPSTAYTSFQARSPYTQWFGVTGNDPNAANAIYKLAGQTGYSPAAHAAVGSMESRFNPAQKTGQQYGIFQMSGTGNQNMWADAPFRGTMGGLTFPQYKTASAPAQIGAYGDWLTRGNVNTLNRGYNFQGQSPPMQAAALQAMQFGGGDPKWRTQYAAGNLNYPVTQALNQARELITPGQTLPTMNSMFNAYTNKMSGWGR